MPPFAKKKDEPGIDRANVPIGVKAAAYLALKKQESAIRKQLAELRVSLEKHLELHKSIDVNESEYVVVQHAGQAFEIVNTAVKTTEVVGDAIQIIEREATFDACREDLLEEVIDLRIDRIEDLILEGKLTEEDTLKFMKVNTHYSFKVKKIRQ